MSPRNGFSRGAWSNDGQGPALSDVSDSGKIKSLSKSPAVIVKETTNTTKSAIVAES